MGFWAGRHGGSTLGRRNPSPTPCGEGFPRSCEPSRPPCHHPLPRGPNRSCLRGGRCRHGGQGSLTETSGAGSRGEQPGSDQERGPGRTRWLRQDHPGRDAARHRRSRHPRGHRRRRHHRLRRRPRRAPPPPVPRAGPGPGRARGHQDQPPRHPRVRRLRGRAARRAARRGLRALRRRCQRGRRREHPRRVARVRGGRHAARRRRHQARPGPGRLRGGARPGAGRLRRQGAAALRPGPPGRRGDRARRPARPLRPRARGAAGRADRGRDRGVRGRGPHGPVRRRRGDRRQGAARRPRASRRPGDVLPRRPGVLGQRGRLHRAARPGGARLPLPRRAPLSGGVHPRGQGRGADRVRPRWRRWSPRS